MLQKFLKKRQGFTLIELMIVVVIIGILASVAVPAFIRFVKRSKTAEATANLGALYNGAQTYYTRENAQRLLVTAGTTAAASTACVVAGGETMTTPGSNKVQIDQTTTTFLATFAPLGFAPSGPVYYRYGVSAAASTCGLTANNTAVYTFVANGDLDGDTTVSTFEMAVGSDAENSLYHGAGLYIVDELE